MKTYLLFRVFMKDYFYEKRSARSRVEVEEDTFTKLLFAVKCVAAAGVSILLRHKRIYYQLRRKLQQKLKCFFQTRRRFYIFFNPFVFSKHSTMGLGWPSRFQRKDNAILPQTKLPKTIFFYPIVCVRVFVCM